MVEGVIPQAHLQKESVYFFIYTNFNTFIELTPGLKEMSENKLKTEEELSQSILYKIRHFFSSRQKLKDENSKLFLTCVPTVMLGIEEMPALDFGFLFLALAFSSIFFR